jgi:ferritin
MLSAKMQEALNKQINAELYSSYLYLSMSSHFESASLKGFAHWLRVQAGEERGHAEKFFDHINDRGGRVTLLAVQAPPAEWASPLAAFEEVYRHEQKVTGLINDLVNMAVAERDHASNEFLQWFVKEQVEEEAQSLQIVQDLRRVGESAGGLLVLDHHLGKRGQ